MKLTGLILEQMWLARLAAIETHARTMRTNHPIGPGRRTADTIHNGARNMFTSHCGERERARNRRRIAAGQLRAENGLDLEERT